MLDVGAAETDEVVRRDPGWNGEHQEARQAEKSRLVRNQGGIITGSREMQGIGGAAGPEEEEEGVAVAVAATAEA